MSHQLMSTLEYKRDRLYKAWASALRWIQMRPEHFDVFGSIADADGKLVYSLLGLDFPITLRPVIWNLNDFFLEVTLAHPDPEAKALAVWYTDGNVLYGKLPAVMETRLIQLSGDVVEHFWELLAHTATTSAAFAPTQDLTVAPS